MLPEHCGRDQAYIKPKVISVILEFEEKQANLEGVSTMNWTGEKPG